MDFPKMVIFVVLGCQKAIFSDLSVMNMRRLFFAHFEHLRFFGLMTAESVAICFGERGESGGAGEA